MAEGKPDVPRIALITGPGEPDCYPGAALLALARHDGWDARLIRNAPARRNPLARALRRRRAAPHLLHLPSTRAAHDWLELAKRIDARMLVNVGSDELSAAAFHSPQLYTRVWAAADRLVVESDALADLLRQHGAPAGESAVSVVPPAADRELLGSEPAPPRVPGSGPFRILSIGPLSWTRGYEHAIAAVRLLRDSDIACEYRIVGSGEHLDAVAFARHQLGLQDCIELLEPGPPDELRVQFRWADALVNVALPATSPKPILDAQAAGAPVVSTEAPADDNGSVLLVPPLDPEALAGALTRVVRDEAMRARLVSAGRERARGAPTPAVRAARLHELSRELVPSV